MPDREGLSHLKIKALSWLAASAWCSGATDVVKRDATSKVSCKVWFALSVLGCQDSWDTGALRERRKMIKYLYKLAVKYSVFWG